MCRQKTSRSLSLHFCPKLGLSLVCTVFTKMPGLWTSGDSLFYFALHSRSMELYVCFSVPCLPWALRIQIWVFTLAQQAFAYWAISPVQRTSDWTTNSILVRWLGISAVWRRNLALCFFMCMNHLLLASSMGGWWNLIWIAYFNKWLEEPQLHFSAEKWCWETYLQVLTSHSHIFVVERLFNIFPF